MLLFTVVSYAQQRSQADVVFSEMGDGQAFFYKFVPGRDMFFRLYGDNDAELIRLNAAIDRYRDDIVSGSMRVHVDGYSASEPTHRQNINMSFVRANRVKSEMIINMGLLEKHFFTRNFAVPFEGHNDIVVVRLFVSEAFVRPQRPPEPESRTEQVQESKQEEPPVQTQEQVRPSAQMQEQPATVCADPAMQTACECKPAPASKTRHRPFCRFDLRTNLLYDALLTPTLGIEWRINRHVGIKLDGSRSWWGDEHGKVQKIWLLNPEIRWYLLENKSLYVGAGANFGQYNIYGGILGGTFPENTGYQGDLWGAGITVGYQLRLARRLSLDFNLGLGYTRLDYDAFHIIEETRIYKYKNGVTNFWGPTQAGISLVWTIGSIDR